MESIIKDINRTGSRAEVSGMFKFNYFIHDHFVLHVILPLFLFT